LREESNLDPNTGQKNQSLIKDIFSYG